MLMIYIAATTQVLRKVLDLLQSPLRPYQLQVLHQVCFGDFGCYFHLVTKRTQQKRKNLFNSNLQVNSQALQEPLCTRTVGWSRPQVGLNHPPPKLGKYQHHPHYHMQRIISINIAIIFFQAQQALLSPPCPQGPQPEPTPVVSRRQVRALSRKLVHVPRDASPALSQWLVEVLAELPAPLLLTQRPARLPPSPLLIRLQLRVAQAFQRLNCSTLQRQRLIYWTRSSKAEKLLKKTVRL